MGLVTDMPDDTPTTNVFADGDTPTQAKVKIVGGLSEYALDDPPKYGEERTYIVKGWCKKVHLDEVDGEPRMTVDIYQTSIYERGKVPIVDEPQPGLFDSAAPADTPEPDSGPELADTSEPTKAFEGGPSFSGIESGA